MRIGILGQTEHRGKNRVLLGTSFQIQAVVDDDEMAGKFSSMRPNASALSRSQQNVHDDAGLLQAFHKPRHGGLSILWSSRGTLRSARMPYFFTKCWISPGECGSSGSRVHTRAVHRLCLHRGVADETVVPAIERAGLHDAGAGDAVGFGHSLQIADEPVVPGGRYGLGKEGSVFRPRNKYARAYRQSAWSSLYRRPIAGLSFPPKGGYLVLCNVEVLSPPPRPSWRPSRMTRWRAAPSAPAGGDRDVPPKPWRETKISGSTSATPSPSIATSST